MRTAIQIIPDLGALCIVIIVLVMMAAVIGVLILGGSTSQFSTMSSALHTIWMLLLVGDDSGESSAGHADLIRAIKI